MTITCITDVADLRGIESNTLEKAERELMKKARERASNPDDATEVQKQFEDLLNKQVEWELNSAARKERQAISNIRARQKNRRAYQGMRRQKKLDQPNKDRFGPATAAAEVVNSVGEVVKNRTNSVYQGFLFDLENEGLDTFFRDPGNDISILIEIGEVNKKHAAQPGITGSKEAQRIAELFQSYTDAERAILAENGVPIGDLEGRMMKNTLDAQSLSRVTKEQFIRDFIYRIDRQKMFDRNDVSDAEARKLLGEIYDSKVQGDLDDIPLSRAGGQKQESVFANGIAKPREVHLLGAEDVKFMADKYGPGSVKATLLESLRKNARNAALIEEMGADPRNSLEQLRTEAARDATENVSSEEAKKLTNPTAWDTMMGRDLTGIMNQVDGTSMGGDSTRIREIGIAVNNLARFALLGEVTLASVPDIGSFNRAVDRMGVDLGPFHGRLIQALRKNSNMSLEEEKRMAGAIAQASRHMNVELYDISPNSTMTGKVANGSQSLSHFTFKYSLGQFWQRNMQKAAQTMWGSIVGQSMREGRTWDNLSSDMQNLMLRSGIQEEDWDTLRGLQDWLVAEDPMNDNVPTFIPDVVDSIDDESVARRIIGKPNATQRDINNARNDLRRKAVLSAHNFTNLAVISPDARTASALTLDTQAGSGLGFFARTTTSLLSWPYAFTQRAVGGEFERGLTAKAALGFGRLTAMMTMYGFIAESASEVLGGNENPDILSDDPQVQARNFAEVLSRAGAGGLAGTAATDYLLYNAPPVETGGAPLSVLGDAASDFTGGLEDMVLNGDFEKGLSKQARIIDTLTPNLPVAKPLADAIIFDAIQENIDPARAREDEQNELISF